MNEQEHTGPGRWNSGDLPANVLVGRNSLITGNIAFKRFFSHREPALTIGESCTIDGVQFALGGNARVSIGNYCFFSSAVLLCELELQIGNYVVIGWNVTVADTDFHPISPAARIEDAFALSPLGKGRARPPIDHRPVVIEDDVWIGPNAAILKGVHVGQGAIIEPGSLITRDVPPRARMLGNPARAIDEV
jgi:acetyltransferase-like isoleucine patch superfamily enzyme